MINRLLKGINRVPTRVTKGLTSQQLKPFENDKNLCLALERAANQYAALPDTYKAMVHDMPETECIQELQKDYMNFYSPSSVNPYVALAAQGPWVVTAHGGVMFDSGGYGMLGFGHNPPQLMEAMSEPAVQANIMTPSFSQLKFAEAMRKEIGHSRGSDFKDPYKYFMCLNSGSESVSLACRISDTHSKTMTDPGAPHEGRQSIFLTLERSFHGRTDRPASLSNSTQKMYQKYLKSYGNWNTVRTIKPNCIQSLQEAFAQADKDGLHVEMLTLEPVAGEGNPGVVLTSEFYNEARRLTIENHSLLLVDSIQAGLRTRGNLSITDSDLCSDLQAPDFETFSKALLGGQYPFSVLAVNARVADCYKLGLYGNTMTTNPRGLNVATATLESMTDELRTNIRDKGDRFKEVLVDLQKAHPDVITEVTGTGLLLAAHVVPEIAVEGKGGLEERVRKKGLNVIHGGTNALRFTPWFHLADNEIDLMADVLHLSLNELKAE